MNNILVPTDFSEAAAAALKYALKLARITSGKVTLLHAIYIDKINENLLGLDALEHLAQVMSSAPQDSPYSPTSATWKLRDAAQAKLNDAISAQTAPPNIETAVVEGRPSIEIVDYATKHAVDQIVMGTQGRGMLGRAFLGSVAENVIRTAECPVTVVRK